MSYWKKLSKVIEELKEKYPARTPEEIIEKGYVEVADEDLK